MIKQTRKGALNRLQHSTANPCQACEILHSNKAEIGFGHGRGTCQSHPLSLDTSSPCQISAMFFFLVSPTTSVLVDPTLLHSYLGLCSKVFWVEVPYFGHALHWLSTIWAILFITYNTNKTLISNLIFQLFELNLARMRCEIQVSHARASS